jgi:aspartokinase/homoserine dehydrogenase 1
MEPSDMKVLKFGGTSVGSVDAIKKLIEIVRNSGEKLVVVSAFSGVTDKLIEAARLAENQRDYVKTVTDLRDRHIQTASSLLEAGSLQAEIAHIDRNFDEIKNLLFGIALLRDLSKRTLDLVMSFGERLSASIIAMAFSSSGIDAQFVDARDLIRTDSAFGSARYLEKETCARIVERLKNPTNVHVITGFIGSTADGLTTTLGRGGSDLTAGILGACLDVEEIEIWTDVDGILTSDPRLVPDAFLIDEISYEEALEMSHFGAKVLHPPTVQPAMQKGIPIRIKNTFNSEGSGTLIVKHAKPSPYPVRGLASIASVSLLKLQGPGMPGVTGIASRMFGALATAKINVILITQASSELSICCAVNPEDALPGAKAIKDEFDLEIGAGLIDEPVIESDLCILAIVGEKMKRRVGISGRVFKALGRNGINVVTIAQGSSELNISVVISSQDRAKALNSIHDAFFLAGMRTVNVFLVGTGLIGSTLLSQIEKQKARLFSDHMIRINLAGLANSRKMLVDPHGIDPAVWRQTIEESGKAEHADIRRFIDTMKRLNLPSACFCDCTASEVPPGYYAEILNSSIAIVTPNKRANAGAIERYRELKDTALERDVPYRYETTVGAGLPIIGTLHDLVASGDAILRIEAVLSGTISFIFNEMGGAKTFSALVKEAKTAGYTEPDPRDDLGAVDAARKTLILIREAGFPIEYQNIAIEPLLPEACVKAKSIEEFLEVLPMVDEQYDSLKKKAAAEGKVLRYVSTITPNSASLALAEFGVESPFYNLHGTENLVMFTTERYRHNPLVVRGPGAGAGVTAGGVFADILKTAQSYL